MLKQTQPVVAVKLDLGLIKSVCFMSLLFLN